MHKTRNIVKYSFLAVFILILIVILLGYTNLGNLSKIDDSKYIYVNINNENIRVFQKGTGRDILFIHGSPGIIEDWHHIIDSLAEKYRITAFDRPGHGFSSSKKYTYHIKDNAVLAESLIDQLGLKKPLIVGHSYGGSTAAYMALNTKRKDLEYIIIDSPLYSARYRKIYKLIATPVIGKGIALFSSYTIAGSQIRDGLVSIFKNTPSEKMNALIEERQKIWSQPKVIYTKSKESMNYQDDLDEISDKYKEITAGITIITTTDNTSPLKKDCEKFHSEVKNSELILLDNTGHYVQFDRADGIIKAINQRMEANKL